MTINTRRVKLLRNTRTEYGRVSKFLHTLLTILVFIMLGIGFFHTAFSNKTIIRVLMAFHKSLGIVLLTLAIFMILWRLTNPKPEWPNEMRQWECILARVTHTLLYLLLVLMPLAGWIMTTAANRPPLFFGFFILKAPFVPVNMPLARIANEVHKISAFALLGLILLHTIGALKHYFINKDNILQRMCGK